MDALAYELFRRAGLRDEPTGPAHLAVRLLGADGLRWGRASQIPEYVVSPDPDRIELRIDLPDGRLTMAIARGIARWGRDRIYLPMGDDGGRSWGLIEDLALCVAMPANAFRRAADYYACDIGDLADAFVCPRGCVATRMTHLDLRGVGPKHLRMLSAS